MADKDIVERLREEPGSLAAEAAVEIKWLREEIWRLLDGSVEAARERYRVRVDVKPLDNEDSVPGSHIVRVRRI